MELTATSEAQQNRRRLKSSAVTSLPTTTENAELCEKSATLRRLGAFATWLDVLTDLALLNVVR